MIARLLRVLFAPMPGRLDGVAAVDWRNSVFTRDRTDLPYPAPRPRPFRWPDGSPLQRAP